MLMKGRGQMQMSFTMIFSIILIIVTIAVAIYAIAKFMDTSNCLKVRLYYEDLEKEAERVWRSAAADATFRREVPKSVQSICFGDTSKLDARRYPAESQALRSSGEGNTYLYPRSVCETSLASREIAHVTVPAPFCARAENRHVTIHLSKTSSEELVSAAP